MIIQERDFLTGRVTRKELLDPYIPHSVGASPGIVYPSDMYVPDEPQSAWEKESYQVLMQGQRDIQEVWASQFETGLRRIAGANEKKDTIWDEIWNWITGNIWDFLSGGKVGVDPKVLQAIQKVEAECGLTEDLKWAYAWYDRRYPLPLGNSWKGYVYYVSQWALFPWDKSHYVNCATHCLNQLQNYLQAALSKAAGRPVGGIMDFLKKYGSYLAMGGAGLALILVLATRGRAPAPIYILPEKK